MKDKPAKIQILILNCDFDKNPATNSERILVSGLKKNKNLQIESVAVFEKGLHIKKSLKYYDRVIITGSEADVSNAYEWISRLSLLIKKLDKAKIPTLGICFGAQIIASSLSGTVAKNNKFEKGFKQININDAGIKDALFDGLPKRFKVYQYHGCIITKLPPKAKVLSRNRKFVEAYSIRNMYGVQFHPEIMPSDAKIIAISEGENPITALNNVKMSYSLSSRIISNFIKASN